MDKRGDQPRLRLIERSGDEPSRIVVTPLGAGRLERAWRWMIRRGLALAARLGNTVSMPAPAPSEELLSYTPKRDKVVEGVLFLLEQAPQRGFAMTVDALIAVMFLTDKGHLDAYGRPVFFDNYVATEKGPAGVAASEMLDRAFDWSSVGNESAPWTFDPDVGGHAVATRGPNLRRLSETDVEALSSALAMVASLDAGQLRLFTHRNVAYASAWANGAGAGSRLDPRLVPDLRDDGMIDDLLYASRHAFVAPRRG